MLFVDCGVVGYIVVNIGVISVLMYVVVFIDVMLVLHLMKFCICVVDDYVMLGFVDNVCELDIEDVCDCVLVVFCVLLTCCVCWCWVCVVVCDCCVIC